MLEKLQKAELLALAEAFGVEVNSNSHVGTIVSALEENGVTWDLAKQTVPTLAERFAAVETKVKEEEAAVKATLPTTLLKMDRQNFTYQVRGYTFTKTHPFAIVTEEDAEFITENIEGFRYASPKEAAEFYG